jgi:large subunit ribosomal protein L15
MQQHQLRQPKGATHRRKRVGRGNASGHGTYATKGLKGQKARSGGGVRPGFEGGQLPLVRRMAYKRGFRNPFRVDYEEVNVRDLARFPAGDVTVAMLREARLVRTSRPVKVLGEGELDAALTVEADAFSTSARTKIEAAGGAVRWIGGPPPEPEPEAGDTEQPAKQGRAKASRGAAEAGPAAEATSDSDSKVAAPTKRARGAAPAPSDDAAAGGADADAGPAAAKRRRARKPASEPDDNTAGAAEEA